VSSASSVSIGWRSEEIRGENKKKLAGDGVGQKSELRDEEMRKQRSVFQGYLRTIVRISIRKAGLREGAIK
jgi:hypothetical protein